MQPLARLHHDTLSSQRALYTIMVASAADDRAEILYSPYPVRQVRTGHKYL